MSRPNKLNAMARYTIARAYGAGARPSEIAVEWGISPSLVIEYARRRERDLKKRVARSAARLVPLPVVVKPKVIKTYAPLSEDARELNLRSFRWPMGSGYVSLAWVSGVYDA